MSKILAALLLLVTLAATPFWLMMAGFAPMLLDSASVMSALQKILGSMAIAAIWLVPVWVLYFARRMFKAWRGLRSPLPSAFMMALPAIGIIGFMLAINLRMAP